MPLRTPTRCSAAAPWCSSTAGTIAPTRGSFTRHPDGTTDIDYVVVRDGKNAKGRLLELVFRTVGKSKLEKAFVNSVKAIEARNYERATAGSRSPGAA